MLYIWTQIFPNIKVFILFKNMYLNNMLILYKVILDMIN